MDLLIKRIQAFEDNKSLKSRWDDAGEFQIDCPICAPEDIIELNNQTSVFDRFILLKEMICKRAQGNYENEELNEWLITKWGGIKWFKYSSANRVLISKLCRQLHKGQMTKDVFSKISSFSKIASFIEPSRYVIYDSRVIYVFNWLIATTACKSLKFFPIPEGRNHVMRNFDMKTIINLLHADRISNEDALFYTHREAYFVFCRIIREITNQIYGEEKRPYLTEMLIYDIFSNIFPTEFFRNLTVRLNT